MLMLFLLSDAQNKSSMVYKFLDVLQYLNCDQLGILITNFISTTKAISS